MKHLFFLIGALFLLSGTSQASPLQPWDHYLCSPIRQDDGKKIGAVCYSHNYELQVDVLEVYYFGFLWENKGQYRGFYVNLSVDGSHHARRGLLAKNFGDGNNLPVRQVLTATYIVSTHFQRHPLTGKGFSVYFQAEQKVPTNSPPFSYDDNFKRTYGGRVGRQLL
jgi:hypothetical protein